MRIKAVIFDMNGTIVDDEPLHEEAMRKVCKIHGVELSHEEFAKEYIGRPDNECFQEIIRRHGVKGVPVNELMGQKAREYISFIHDETTPERLKIVPGVLRLLKSLQKQFLLALATGARREEAMAILELFGIKKFFGVIVTVEDVLRGKPDPEPYQLAVQRLGVRPEECVAIEDSPHGIRSAKRANIYSIGFHNKNYQHDLSEADLEVSSLSEISVTQITNLS